MIRFLIKIFKPPKFNSINLDYDLYSINRFNNYKLNKFQTFRINWIRKRINTNSKILDFGCGNGIILSNLIDNISHAYAVDLSVNSLSQIQDNQKITKINRINIDDINLDYDYAFALEIIEHVINSEEIVIKLFEKSKSGIFISIPNTGFILYRLRLLFGRFPIQWRTHPAEHIRFWTYSDFIDWINFLPLKYSKIEYVGYCGFPLLNKLLPSIFSMGLIVKIEK